MESQSKEKRSKALQFIALGSLVALSSTFTGCSNTTAIASKDKDKEKEKKEKEENNTTGGYHYYGGGSRIYAPLGSSGTSRPAVGTVSRGWFGGFHFSGG